MNLRPTYIRLSANPQNFWSPQDFWARYYNLREQLGALEELSPNNIVVQGMGTELDTMREENQSSLEELMKEVYFSVEVYGEWDPQQNNWRDEKDDPGFPARLNLVWGHLTRFSQANGLKLVPLTDPNDYTRPGFFELYFMRLGEYSFE